MIDNTSLLQDFLLREKIELENSPILGVSPCPLPEDWSFDRVEGMLLGLAIGDALGNTSESMLPRTRQQLYGEIRDYLPNRYADNRSKGVPSDDTQLSFWTLEQLLDDGGLVPEHLAASFSQQRIYGIGNTVMGFVHAYGTQHRSWDKAGQHSAGNGALMRIAPVVIPHLHNPSPALWADAALAGMVTHNDRASNACCIAFTHVLWECLRLEETPDPAWWLQQFTSFASQLEGDTHYAARLPGAVHDGPVWQFVEREVSQALREGLSVLEACNRWYSGAYLLETMPCVLYILARHGNDPEEAVVRAVNDSKDNDTVAAIVGAAVGALHGKDALPRRWVENLLGRLGADDDGHICHIIRDAKESFWVGASTD